MVTIAVLGIGCGSSRQELTHEELVAIDQATVAQQKALRQDTLDTLIRGLQNDIANGREPHIDI